MAVSPTATGAMARTDSSTPSSVASQSWTPMIFSMPTIACRGGNHGVRAVKERREGSERAVKDGERAAERAVSSHRVDRVRAHDEHDGRGVDVLD